MKHILLFLRKIRWIIRQWSEITPYSRVVNKPDSAKLVVIPHTHSHGNTIGYFSDGMLIWNNCDCLREERFATAYRRSLEVNDWRGRDGKGMDMRWRYYIICWFADYVKGKEGDFVECGVYKGGYTVAIMNYIDFESLNKTYWLFDTFNGLVKNLATKEENDNYLSDKYQGYEECYEDVCKTFAATNTKIIRGPVPETLRAYTGESICFLSLDMNMVTPEIEAARFFWSKLVPGGIIVLDDYGFYAHGEQKKAFDVFVKENNAKLLSLPTGQAIIFKNQG